MVASDISDQSQAFCLAGGLVRLNPIPNKDRATNPPQEKPGGEGWLAGRSSKQNIQPGARGPGIWMSDLCRRLMVETGFDPEVLKRKGKVIRDLAIERGWDREKFAGFDQPLQDRVSAFYASSNEAFAQ